MRKRFKTKLAVGVDNFAKLREKGCYYVDKTLLIKELLDSEDEVHVFTRPRRFGKSLNISMLRYFFDVLHQKEAPIFDGLNIMAAGAEYTQHQNAHPVIQLTLKGAEGLNFESALMSFTRIVSKEYERHRYLLESQVLDDKTKAYVKRIIDERNVSAYEGSTEGKHLRLADFKSSLLRLSEILHMHHRQKVIILIDEYDVPLEKAYFAVKGSYYDEMVDFTRGFLGDALKTNDVLERAIMTGCLRVAKESIFTGINNLTIVSILSAEYDEYFGLTETEVEVMFEHYEMMDNLPIAKAWYNGYQFGNTIVYSPWSLIKHVSSHLYGNPFPIPHWSNTASNLIIRELIDMADDGVKAEIETLMAGGTIKKEIAEDIVYQDIKKNMSNLWNFLYFTGYLTKGSAEILGRKRWLELKVPNEEVAYIFDRHVREWFEEDFVKRDMFNELYEALLIGDPETMGREIDSLLMKAISYLDNHENFYHGFMVGILMPFKECMVKSNREAGHGRSDIFLKGKTNSDKAIILELKVADKVSELEKMCHEALAQIEEKNYAQALLDDGYEEIETYGIAFFKKRCFVVKGKSIILKWK